MNMKVTIQDKTYQVRIEDVHARPLRVEVEGEIYEVWPEESSASLLASTNVPAPVPVSTPPAPVSTPTVDATPQAIDSQVKAPIPGVIIDILVSPCQAVVYGQELCVLEAMKMKNSIRAGRDGVIEQILVKSSQQVNQNQVLMTYRTEEK